MPRELTRQSVRQEAAGKQLGIRVSFKEKTVRVALSGMLDRDGFDDLVAHTAPWLLRRNMRVVIDGTNLLHLDYRVTPLLVRWNRQLRRYHHQLYLQGWSDYLRAILRMEDWDRELGDRQVGAAAWRLMGEAPASQMP